MDTVQVPESSVPDDYSVNTDPGDGNRSDVPGPVPGPVPDPVPDLVLDLDNNIQRDKELPGRDADNDNVDPGLGRTNNNAHRDGQNFQSNLESEGCDDVPFRNLFGEDFLFNYMAIYALVPTASSSDANRLHNRSYRLHNRFYRRVNTLVETSQVKKDSDSDSESESDDKEEKELDSFLSIPFFIKNRELDLDSPCIPLLGDDDWKEEWYSDKVKVASHHVNWWRQRKEEGSGWYSDKVKDACQQLAEVDWWRHLNQRDWDNHAYLLEGLDLELGIEEELNLEDLEELEDDDVEKHYVTRTFYDQDRTGLSEAIQTGLGQLNGIPVALGVMDFEFIGGSMGYIVGDRITRLIELASHLGLPLIIVCASGGARMQEGTLSLMQMAKISSALHYFKKNQKNPLYISMLASPTTGGVTASFGMLGDIIISEPEAYIAFAGKRVIEDTLKLEVPEGSQVAEVAFEKGLLDPIIPREMLKGVLSELLQLHNYFPLTPMTPKIKGFLS